MKNISKILKILSVNLVWNAKCVKRNWKIKITFTTQLTMSSFVMNAIFKSQKITYVMFVWAVKVSIVSLGLNAKIVASGLMIPVIRKQLEMNPNSLCVIGVQTVGKRKWGRCFLRLSNQLLPSISFNFLQSLLMKNYPFTKP